MGGPRSARLLLVALIAGGLALAGCSKAHPSGTTAPSPGATLSEGPVPGVTATDVASQIQAMIDRAESAENTPFKAQYSITINGKPEALTLEEKGTNQRVSSAGLGEFISTPTVDAFCLASPKQACFAEGSSSNPLAALVAFAEPKAVLDVIQGDEADMAGDTHVYTVTMSTQTHSGARDTCATLRGRGTVTVYCFNAAGVVAYESTPNASLTLKSYTTNVPDGDFVLPASPAPVNP